MEEDFYINLIHKKLDKTISPQELIELNDWINLDSNNKQTFESIQMVWQNVEPLPYSNIDLNDEFEELKKVIDSKTNKTIHIKDKRNSNFKWIKYTSIAASLLILFAISNKFLFNNTSNNWTEITAEFDTQKVTLPDNSTVILRKNSVYKYSNDYMSSRKSELIGEGFFEVTPNSKNVFEVSTKHGSIKVLGTSFNVKSEKDKTTVGVKTGKVSVTNLEGNEAILIPGKGVTIKENQSKLEPVYNLVKQEINWSERYFKFENEILSNVISKISKAYPVKIKIDEEIKNCPITVSFDNQSLDIILESLNTMLSSDIVKINSNYYSIKNGGCGE